MRYEESMRRAEELLLDMYRSNFVKDKVGHRMIEWRARDGSHRICDIVIGPEAGYSPRHKHWSITFEGWGYVLVDDTWYLVEDGKIGWRQSPANPCPDVLNAPDDVNVLEYVSE